MDVLSPSPSDDHCLEMVPLPSKTLINLDEQNVFICIGDQRINLNDWIQTLGRNPSALALFNKIPRVVQLVRSTSRQQDFVNIVCIGGGAYSSVYSATHRLDGQKYALKILRNINSSRALKHAKDEVEVLARLEHPNIVRYFTCWIEADIESTNARPLVQSSVRISSPSSEVSWASSCNSHCSFKDDEDSDEENNNQTTDLTLAIPSNGSSSMVPAHLCAAPKSSLFIQMELCQYTLEDWLKYRNSLLFSASSLASADTCSISSLSEAERLLRKQPWSRLRRAPVRWLFDQIAQGVAYLHAHGILHRDLKPANVFLQGPPFGCISEIPCNCNRSHHAMTVFDPILPEDFSSKTEEASVCYHNLHVKIGDFGLSTLLANGTNNTFSSNLPNTTTSNFKALPAPIPVLFSHSGSSEIVPSLQPTAQPIHTALLTGNLGTLFYAAPEVLQSNHSGRCVYGFKADMYSLSVILFQLLYPSNTESELIFHISQFQRAEQERGKPSRDFLPREIQFLWPAEADLLTRLMSSSPVNRPTAEEVLNYLASTSEILESGRPHSADRRQNGGGEETVDVEEIRLPSISTLLDRLLYRNHQLEEEVSRLRQQLSSTTQLPRSEVKDRGVP